MDILFERKACIYAKQIIQLIQNEFHEGYVADITLLNIDYVAKKQKQEARKFLYFIEDNFTITGANNGDMVKALELENLDLEDNLQYILAKKSACELIISNDKSFIQSSLPVLDAELFLMRCSPYRT
ncbi:MAG: PIN domain-containing protein [Methyloprofundus sp.]|nr:PIN domain-containing protein [Methyloprofundus sp.]